MFSTWTPAPAATTRRIDPMKPGPNNIHASATHQRPSDELVFALNYSVNDFRIFDFGFALFIMRAHRISS